MKSERVNEEEKYLNNKRLRDSINEVNEAKLEDEKHSNNRINKVYLNYSSPCVTRLKVNPHFSKSKFHPEKLEDEEISHQVTVDLRNMNILNEIKKSPHFIKNTEKISIAGNMSDSLNTQITFNPKKYTPTSKRMKINENAYFKKEYEKAFNCIKQVNPEFYFQTKLNTIEESIKNIKIIKNSTNDINSKSCNFLSKMINTNCSFIYYVSMVLELLALIGMSEIMYIYAANNTI